MKLLSSYIKEMKIAARGFYFYIEIFMAVIILVILLFGVKEYPQSKVKEFIFYDMSIGMKSALLQKEIDKGALKLADPTEIKMKAAAFSVKNKETEESKSYAFDEEIRRFDTFKAYNPQTGELQKTTIVTDSEDNLIRLAWQENRIGTAIGVDEGGMLLYRDYLQGYETKRYENLLTLLQDVRPDTLQASLENQTVIRLENIETLNSRQNLIPLMVVLMGSLMGFFIVMAYIFLDKDEGVIRAIAVTPSSVWKYLLSKIMVIMTSVTVSSSIFTIPVMGAQPDYLLFYSLLLVSSFSFSSLGLLVSSFFNSISKAFGTLYIRMIVLMLPAFSYFVPSFDPLWMRFFPTYPLLQGMKEIMMKNTDISYVLFYIGVFSAGGLLLFLLANHRFKKSLTV